MPHSQPARLDPEEVVLAAMSVTGSAERLWKLARGHANAWMNAAVLHGLLRLITLGLGERDLLVRLLPPVARAVPGQPALPKRSSISQSLLEDAGNQQLGLPPALPPEDPDWIPAIYVNRSPKHVP